MRLSNGKLLTWEVTTPHRNTCIGTRLQPRSSTSMTSRLEGRSSLLNLAHRIMDFGAGRRTLGRLLLFMFQWKRFVRALYRRLVEASRHLPTWPRVSMGASCRVGGAHGAKRDTCTSGSTRSLRHRRGSSAASRARSLQRPRSMRLAGMPASRMSPGSLDVTRRLTPWCLTVKARSLGDARTSVAIPSS